MSEMGLFWMICGFWFLAGLNVDFMAGVLVEMEKKQTKPKEAHHD